MAATATYSASMRTRKTSSSGNAKSAVACQEYYDDSYNYVGIVHFSGMALSGKVITSAMLMNSGIPWLPANRLTFFRQ